MVLYTGCLYDYKKGFGRVGISTILKHCKVDGSKDEDITLLNYDLHMPILAPNRDLILGYYRGKYNWDDYEIIFNKQIREKKTEEILIDIGKKSLDFNIYLLCVDKFVDKCHRRLLAERSQQLVSKVEIIHLEPLCLSN